jgi:hypothetical protein
MKRLDCLVSAKQIARLAKKSFPMYILHMRELDDDVLGDSLTSIPAVNPKPTM